MLDSFYKKALLLFFFCPFSGFYFLFVCFAEMITKLHKNGSTTFKNGFTHSWNKRYKTKKVCSKTKIIITTVTRFTKVFTVSI